VNWAQPLIECRLRRRLNRFTCLAEIGDREVAVHLANSGRLGDLLVPGARALALRREGRRRRTEYDLAVVFYHDMPVSVDARLPSPLVVEALERGLLPRLSGYTSISREVRFRGKRLDILLGDPVKCYLETKSVTLVREGIALFPDAPTQRGREHLEALRRAVEEGYRAAVVFVAQRADARAFSPNDLVDPEFGERLRRAAAVGLEVYALGCRVTLDGVEIDRSIPVIL